MPDKETVEKAHEDAREGKSPSTQAGEFVHEEMDHIREGKHGAKSTKQAIAIGLSKARRAGVKLPPPKKGRASSATRQKGRASSATRRKARQDSRRSGAKTSAKRSRATRDALKRQPRSAASHSALSRQAKSAASRRSAAARSASAKKAAQTRKRK